MEESEGPQNLLAPPHFADIVLENSRNDSFEMRAMLSIFQSTLSKGVVHGITEGNDSDPEWQARTCVHAFLEGVRGRNAVCSETSSAFQDWRVREGSLVGRGLEGSCRGSRPSWRSSGWPPWTAPGGSRSSWEGLWQPRPSPYGPSGCCSRPRVLDDYKSPKDRTEAIWVGPRESCTCGHGYKHTFHFK